MLQTLLAGKIVLIASWFGALWVWERIRPFAVVRVCWQRWVTNGGLLLINAGLSPVVVLPLTAYAASHSLGWRWAEHHGAWVLFDVVVLDLCLYAWHRANHVVPLLWRFHEVHHLDETLDVSTAVRFHYGEVLLSALLRAGVVFVCGMPLSSVLVFETLVMLSAVFHHANVRLPNALERRLALVIVTPSIHWVHHHAVRHDTDSNYATIFSLWDRLFASHMATPRNAEGVMGVAGRQDPGLVNVLVSPFRKRHRN